MEMLMMDEALDEPTRLRLSGKTLRLTGVEAVEVGEKFVLVASAVAVSVNQERGMDGETERVIELELTRIELQPEQPEQPEPTREQSFYNRSDMAA